LRYGGTEEKQGRIATCIFILNPTIFQIVDIAVIEDDYGYRFLNQKFVLKTIKELMEFYWVGFKLIRSTQILVIFSAENMEWITVGLNSVWTTLSSDQFGCLAIPTSHSQMKLWVKWPSGLCSVES